MTLIRLILLSALAFSSAFTPTSLHNPVRPNDYFFPKQSRSHSSHLYMDVAFSESVINAWESYNVALTEQPLLTKYVKMVFFHQSQHDSFTQYVNFFYTIIVVHEGASLPVLF